MSVTLLPKISSIDYEFWYGGDGPIAKDFDGRSYRVEHVTVATRTLDADEEEGDNISLTVYGRPLKKDGTPNRSNTNLKYIPLLADDAVYERIRQAFVSRFDWQGVVANLTIPVWVFE